MQSLKILSRLEAIVLLVFALGIQTSVCAAVSTPTPCFKVKHIEFNGVHQFSEQEQQRWLQPFLNRCLDVHALKKLLAVVHQAYWEHGFITTRAYLPKQNLKKGTLKVEVIEGKIASITFNKGNFRDRLRLFTAFSPRNGDIFRLEDIEHSVERLRQIPSSSADVKLSPGKAVGTTDIHFQDTLKNPFRIWVGYDNLGQKETGSTRFSTHWEWDNGLGVGDMWALDYVGTLNSNAMSAVISAPFRDSTMTLFHNYSEYLTVLNESAEWFAYSNTSNIQWNVWIKKHREAASSINTIFEHKVSHRAINAFELSPLRLSIARLVLRHIRNFKANTLDMSVGASQGLKLWQVDKDSELKRFASDHPRAQFFKLEADVQFARDFEQAAISSKWHLQHAHHPLYGMEQIALGGVHTIRGYPDGVVSGDLGWTSQNEWKWMLPKWRIPNLLKKYWKSTRPYFFLDMGQIFLHPEGARTTLSALGMGVRGGYHRCWLDFVLAAPLNHHKFPQQIFYGTVQMKLW